MKKIISTLLAVGIMATCALLQTGCVKENFDTVPVLDNVPTWTKSVSIAEVRALLGTGTSALISKRATATNLWTTLEERGIADSSIVFEGTIISCDSAGNFYKTVTMIDETGGIDLSVADRNMYVVYGFKPGQKVLVRVNKLAISNYRGMIQLGVPYTDYTSTGTQMSVTGIPTTSMDKVVQLSGRRGTVEPRKVEINDISMSDVQHLITIDSVQFRSKKATFTENGSSTNRILVNSENYTIVLRTSGYAKFGADSLPTGNGSITGVLGVYNSTYQLIIRDPRDIRFTNEPFNDEIPTPNTTIAQLKSLCTSNIMQITGDVVIGAVVNANDKAGNIYKQIFIEDETGAIQFNVDMAGMNATYPVGTKLAIKCKGLYVGKYGGVVQLGGLYNGGIGRLSESEFGRSVYKLDGEGAVNIATTTIADINETLIGRVINIPLVQFVEADLGSSYAEGAATNRILEDPNGKKIIVRTSSYASFASQQLPEGSGSITAVLSKFVNDYQLYIRDINEVNLTGPRFQITGPDIPTPNTTIAELKALYTTGLLQIAGDVVIEAVVVGDDQTGNIYKTLYIADQTGGITFKINKAKIFQTHPVGTKVVVNCKDMYLGTYGNLIQLGGIYNGGIGQLPESDFNSKVFITATNLPVEPATTTLTTLTDAMLGTLIKLENVHFETPGQPYASPTTNYTQRKLIDANNKTIIVYTSKYATFASTPLPSGTGTVVAILSKYNTSYQLILRSTADVYIPAP